MPSLVRARAAEGRLDPIASGGPPWWIRPLRCPAPEATGSRIDTVSAAWGERVALRDLDLELAPGDRVAVVGPTGSGKSTLASLLLRFVDPVRGRVVLGDQALPELTLDDVRRCVGLVDDDPHVFATTLAENVRLARPDAADADVETALRAARLGTLARRVACRSRRPGSGTVMPRSRAGNGRGW